jgi:hypothetical protein
MDPNATVSADAAKAAIQALSDILQPVAFQQRKLTLPSFWLQDPGGWFQHAEAEFACAPRAR